MLHYGVLLTKKVGHLVADGGDAGGKGDARQRIAAIEGAAADGGERLGQDDLGQSVAITESASVC